MNTNTNAISRHLHEIDLLRFIAALSVVFFHYCFMGHTSGYTKFSYPVLEPIAKYGYLGVDLFFIISGFVILMTANNSGIKKFIISRIARLYPAFWAACSLTFIVVLLFGAPIFKSTWLQYIINMSMLSRFFGVESIEGAYWSLFVEIRFYALVMLILMFRQINNSQRWLILWLAFILAIDLGWLPNSRVLNFALIVDYAPYFIGGCSLYLIHRHGLSGVRATMLIISCALAVQHALTMAHDLEHYYHVDYDPLVISIMIIGFFLILFLIATRNTGRFGAINWSILGALSYPLYLIHQKIGYVIFNATSSLDRDMLMWGTLTVMIVMSFLLNKYVEQRYASKFKAWLTINSTFNNIGINRNMNRP